MGRLLGIYPTPISLGDDIFRWVIFPERLLGCRSSSSGPAWLATSTMLLETLQTQLLRLAANNPHQVDGLQFPVSRYAWWGGAPSAIDSKGFRVRKLTPVWYSRLEDYNLDCWVSIYLHFYGSSILVVSLLSSCGRLLTNFP